MALGGRNSSIHVLPWDTEIFSWFWVLLYLHRGGGGYHAQDQGKRRTLASWAMSLKQAIMLLVILPREILSNTNIMWATNTSHISHFKFSCSHILTSPRAATQEGRYPWPPLVIFPSLPLSSEAWMYWVGEVSTLTRHKAKRLGSDLIWGRGYHRPSFWEAPWVSQKQKAMELGGLSPESWSWSTLWPLQSVQGWTHHLRKSSLKTCLLHLV